MELQILKSSILTLMIMVFAGASLAVTHVVSTDAEFLAATLAAVDGDLVILVPGQYETSGNFTALVTIQGLTGDPEDVYLLVSDTATDSFVDVSGSGGEHSLQLEGLTIRSTFFGSLLDVYSTSVEIRNCIFEGNGGIDNGGVLNARQCNVLVEDSTFRSNASYYSGGAIYVEEGDLNISGCLFSDNRSGAHGGALGVEAGSLTMNDCTFRANSSDQTGGGLFLKNATGTIANSTFEENESTSGGGGLSIGSGSSVEVTGCEVIGNGSHTLAGGVQITGASYAVLSYCIILGNDLFNVGDGSLQLNSSALFHCCEMDLQYWTIAGEAEFNNEGCIVATQQESFDSFKAMYR